MAAPAGELIAIEAKHKSRRADERLSCSRLPSIAPIIAATLMPRSPAICFKLSQNSSSTLTLVLWPAMLIERFKTRDTLPPPRMSQRYDNEPAIRYCDRMTIRTRKNPGLGATGGYRSVAVAV